MWLVESGGTALFWFKDFFTIKKGQWLSESCELYQFFVSVSVYLRRADR
jgi:hypothetical protein